MFDTMTMTKAGGALCGVLLIYLLGVWAAESLYHKAESHDANGEVHTTAYFIDTGSDGDDHGGEEEGPDFSALLAEADTAKGARAFSKCKACHKVGDGQNGIGPHLFGVVGRDIGTADGYSYSSALSGVGGAWTPELLNEWLENPDKFAKGTEMSIKTPKAVDRFNLIAYLQTIGGYPPD